MIRSENIPNAYKNYEDILLATCDNNGKIIVYRKNVKPDKNTKITKL